MGGSCEKKEPPGRTVAAQVMRQVKTRTVSPAPALVACRFNRVAGVSGCKMLGLAPSEKRSPPVGIGAASERFAHVRQLPRSLPIIDRWARRLSALTGYRRGAGPITGGH